MSKQNSPNRVHSLSQLTPGTRVEHILSGQQFIVVTNNGNRVTALDNVVLVVVNDNAHKEWICSTSDKPLSKLKPGDVITKDFSYVITYADNFVLSASRSIEINNPGEYYQI